jgi:hypothetical protein
MHLGTLGRPTPIQTSKWKWLRQKLDGSLGSIKRGFYITTTSKQSSCSTIVRYFEGLKEQTFELVSWTISPEHRTVYHNQYHLLCLVNEPTMPGQLLPSTKVPSSVSTQTGQAEPLVDAYSNSPYQLRTEYNNLLVFRIGVIMRKRRCVTLNNKKKHTHTHTQNTHNKHPCPRWDSNAWSQQANDRRPTP